MHWSAVNHIIICNLSIINISILQYVLYIKTSSSSRILLTFQDMSGPATKPVSMPLDERFHNHLSVQGKLLSTQMNQVLNPVHVQ